MPWDDDETTPIPVGGFSIATEYCAEHDGVNLAILFNGVGLAFSLSFEDFSRMVSDLAAFEIGLRVELGRPPTNEAIPPPGRPEH